jgi:hypothetical protein
MSKSPESQAIIGGSPGHSNYNESLGLEICEVIIIDLGNGARQQFQGTVLLIR